MLQGHGQEMVNFDLESVVEHLGTVNTINLARQHLVGTIRTLEREAAYATKCYRKSRIGGNTSHDIRRALFPACRNRGASRLIEIKRYSEKIRIESLHANRAQLPEPLPRR